MLTWTIHLEGGPKRSNHAAVVIGSRIFSFGGRCEGEDYEITRPIDVHMLNTVTLRWSLLPLPTVEEEITKTPYQRYGHTAVEYEENAYLWGGRNESRGSCNILYRFKGDSLTWDRPEVTGPVPEARDGHTACIISDRMYIFAGFEERTDRFANDIHYLDLRVFEWIRVRVEGMSARWRDFHTATAVGSTMYIFGGRSDLGGDRYTNHEMHLNKVMAYDTVTNTWSKPAPAIPNSPTGRRSHSAFKYKGGIYIFGGYDGVLEVHFNDLHRLDLDTLQWTKLAVPGNSPSPRRRQCACLVGSKVFFFGGTSPRVLDGSSADDVIDRSDFFVLDLEPSLKTLASLVIIKHNLDQKCLPHDLRWELEAMSTENTISKLQASYG